MKMQTLFIGRQDELKRLQSLYNRGNSVLAVIKGRRRIGKSRLVSHFASLNPNARFLSFAGIAPEKNTTAQDQRTQFIKQISDYFKVPERSLTDWYDIFQYLSNLLQPGDIVLFDEISWMGGKDPTFIPKFKAWWDNQTIHHLIILSGSVSTWVEENIIKSTALFGRISLTLTLDPLTISESVQLLKENEVKTSVYDMFKILSILGGIPWYLEQLDSSLSVDENLKNLAFVKDGLLVSEFNRTFHDLFNGKGTTYKQILQVLKDGSKTLAEIRKSLNFHHSGTLSAMMEHLVTAGFIDKQPQWSFKTTKALKQSLYRISDPYTRFFIKMIEPQLPRIQLNEFKEMNLHDIAGFDSHLGLQFECLLLQNRPLLLKAIGIFGSGIVAHGPYRQNKTAAQKGCQIEYLVQTATKNLFLCEFKYSLREIGQDVIGEMEKKISALKIPRYFAPIPVLFHISGVTRDVTNKNYFYRIIDVLDFIDKPKYIEE